MFGNCSILLLNPVDAPGQFEQKWMAGPVGLITLYQLSHSSTKSDGSKPPSQMGEPILSAVPLWL